MTSTMQPQYPPQPALHRKPVPGRPAPSFTNLVPEPQSTHSRTRTSSSSALPSVTTSVTTAIPPNTMQTQQYPTQGGNFHSRRTPSNATASSASTTGTTPARSNSGLRRSSSSASGNSPTSYVALMRKQKATVWCDRSQYEDPRMLAQQRIAKQRANIEVAGGPHHIGAPRTASASSSVAAGVRSKIRHHGAPKASLYAPANLAGTGVPMRLSASEVDEGESDNDSLNQRLSGQGPYHHRSGSGRSSLGSGRRVQYSANPGGRLSTTSTPPSEGMHDLVEEETPVPAQFQSANYFEHTKTGLSGGSGSSGERNYGDISQLPQTTTSKAPQDTKTSDELRRRGSVDDRTMTMGGRLFIANPDLSD